MDFLAANPVLLVSLLIAGAAAGFAGGLFGIGGGIITVPALYGVFKLLGSGEEASLKTAIGTSLGVIIVTSIRSLTAHHRAGQVDMAVLKAWAPWIAFGAGVGGVVSRWAPVELLTLVFAGGALFIAARRLGGKREKKRSIDLSERRLVAPLGLGTGFFSSLMGLGGGALGVMVMTASGRAMHQAVATSAGFGVAVAAPGVIGFIYSGFDAPELPPGSLGYFSTPAFAVMAVMAGLAAPVGARLAHRLNAEILSRLFGVYVLIAAIGLLIDVFGQ